MFFYSGNVNKKLTFVRIDKGPLNVVCDRFYFILFLTSTYSITPSLFSIHVPNRNLSSNQIFSFCFLLPFY